MCETMANIPTEDRSSRVLTEDMFDAAMNQQFSYQNDIESEEELSSQEDNMEIDQDTQGSSHDGSESGTVVHPPENDSNTSITRENSFGPNSPSVSVLVIETGLDKQTVSTCETAQTEVVDSMNNNVIDKSINVSKDNISEPEISLNSNNVQETVRTYSRREKLPILKKILSDSSNENGTSLEPIDLCDSDSEEFSADDELPGVELIDAELKSVMENNLMAEIGMNLNSQKSPEPVAGKAAPTSSPKIAVKSMAHIPSNVFNMLPQNTTDNVIFNPEIMSSSITTSNVINENAKISSTVEGPSQEKIEIPTTIHINRIAVPHQNFVNSQGQKMKCVYLKNSTAVPLVINSNISPNNKASKFVATTQLKRVQAKNVPPIVALSQMALKNMNKKKTVVAQLPGKMIKIAPKLQRPPVLKNALQLPHLNLDENHDSMVKSLLFHNLKKPYNPIDDLAPSIPTVICLDCRDRFVLQSSLDQHLDRRSLSICYWCRICMTELQFFNRCVFLKHLRGHNCSIKNIDTTCITFNPLSQEVIESGVASSFLKESSNSSTKEDAHNKKCDQSTNVTKKVGNTTELTGKTTSSVIVPNPTNTKITTVNGHSKSVCQTKTSVSFNKPISSPVISSESLKKTLPILIKPKSLLVQNVQKQTKNQLTNQIPHLNKPTPNNTLVTNPVLGSSNMKVHTQTNNLPSNIVSEAECIDIDDDLVVDDDTGKTPENREEEEIDIENVTENNVSLLVDSQINQRTKSTTKAASTSLRRFCSECGVSCLNINKHLNGTNRPTNPKLSCEICKLVLPTKCALKIHLRIHMKLPPYKCPDCGKDFNTWDDVNAHVKFSCGHLAKCVRFMCMSCKAHFASPSNLGNHISSTHSRNIFRCILCPVAFFSKESLNKHLKTIHPNEPVLGMDYKQCSMCPKKLVQIEKYGTHVQEHTNANNVLIYGYKCPLCSIVFANKMAFIIHQLKEKNELEEKATTTANVTEKSKCTKLVNGVQEIATLSDNSDIEDEPVIVRKYPEPVDSSAPTEKDPLSLDGWEHPQEQQVDEKREELCIMCKKNVVVLLPGINLNDQSLCCKQCVKPLDLVESKSQQQSVNYINGMRYNQTDLIKNSLNKQIIRKKKLPRAVQRSFSCDDAKTVNKKRKLIAPGFSERYVESVALNYPVDTTGTPVKKRNRKKQPKDKALDLIGQTHIQGQVVDSKSPNELLCAKCEFVADTREVFLNHITAHRTDPNTFQCLECGLCFVVLPSLERHLHTNHGIKDVNVYTENNRCSLPLRVAPVEQESEDNQCRVCYERFDSSSSLEKHFRSHGMAFMNSLSKSP